MTDQVQPANQKKAPRGVAGWVLRLLGSMRLAVGLLAGLFLLTLLGTFHQVEHGLHSAESTYFSSWFLWQPLPWSLPSLLLPGGYLLMGLLALNLVVGGLVRLRWRWRTVGISVVHCGILLLLIAGLVKARLGDEGSLMVWEGESSRHYLDYNQTELVVSRALPDGGIREWAVPDRVFAGIGTTGRAVFSDPEIPFTVTLSQWHEHCKPVRAPAGADGAGVDGYRLVDLPPSSLPPDNKDRRDRGCLATVAGTTLANEQRVLLWEYAEAAPLVTATEQWAIQLRPRRYHLPFTVHLDDFRTEMHGRSERMAAFFESDVTVIDDDGSRRSALIQMNEPLRRSDFILFQSNWGPQLEPDAARHYSVFTVARNPSDQWPNYACWVIAAGLLLHFLPLMFRYLERTGVRTAGRSAASLLLVVAAGSVAGLPGEEPGPVYRQAPWPAAALDAMAHVPVLEHRGTRVTPLDTWAAYRLLRYRGNRTARVQVPTAAGEPRAEALSPVAWFLDMAFFPEQAADYRVFLIEDSAVLEAIDLVIPERKRRDRYSLAELRPGFHKLLEHARRIHGVPEAERDLLDEQLFHLANNVIDAEDLIASFAFTRWRYPVAEVPGLAEYAGDQVDIGVAEFLQLGEAFVAHIRDLERKGGSDQVQASYGPLFASLDSVLAQRSLLALAPGPRQGDEDPGWLIVNEIAAAVWRTEVQLAAWQPALAVVAAWEACQRQRNDSDAFVVASTQLLDQVRSLTVARGEYGKIPLEVSYNRADWFNLAAYAFGIAVLLTMLVWLRPGSAWLYWSNLGVQLVGMLLAATGITMRCIIKGHAPVSTLYETILFIGTVGVVILLILELINRARIAGSISAFFGLFLMVIAIAFELSDAQDTLKPLVAVLDSNYWLTIHVLAITIGYCAGLVAGALALSVLFSPSAARGRLSAEARTRSAMVYGTLALALIFSVVGTILGGVWANDSWGRFWGWDPKENGALLICIWQIAMLHMRKIGILREWGFALFAVAGMLVICFSWWHVNLLGVGLHSYGHTSGIKKALFTAYALLGSVLLAAIIWRLAIRRMTVGAGPAAILGSDEEGGDAQPCT